MEFIDKNFNHFVNKDIKQLSELNDSTNDKLLELMAKNYRKLCGSKSDIERGKCENCKTYSLEFEMLNVFQRKHIICKNCKK